MKKFLTAFSMAWGMYCNLPCPIKKWDEKQRSLMLGWLPTVGFAIGVVWALVYFALVYIGMPYLMVTFFVVFMPFILSGFMHMDGFMDCSDAIMSRRPLPERQRILKDSHSGAFAIICVGFLLLFDYSCIGTAISLGLDFTCLVLIAVLSRSVSGLEVLLSKPMQTSQYNRMHEEGTRSGAGTAAESAADEVKSAKTETTETVKTEGPDTAKANSAKTEESKSEAKAEGPDLTGTTIDVIKDEKAKMTPVKTGVILLLVQAVIFTALSFVFSSNYITTAMVTVFTIVGTLLFARHGKKQLGGMNGDIAGYAILWGEALGMFALVL